MCGGEGDEEILLVPLTAIPLWLSAKRLNGLLGSVPVRYSCKLDQEPVSIRIRPGGGGGGAKLFGFPPIRHLVAVGVEDAG